MPRLSADQWESVRAEREAGASFPELAARHGVSHQAIQQQAKKQGWSDGQDVRDVVRRKVAEKLVGYVASCNPKKRAEALDEAANKAAVVVEMHQQEWADHRERFGIPSDFEIGKLAKISAEMLTIRQKGERIAHGLEDTALKPDITIQWVGLAASYA
jgi:hypothetical protein